MAAILVNALRYSRPFVNGLKTRIGSERGQDLIEYALLGGVIAVAIFALVGLAIFSDALVDMATGIAGCIDFTDGGCNPGP